MTDCGNLVICVNLGTVLWKCLRKYLGNCVVIWKLLLETCGNESLYVENWDLISGIVRGNIMMLCGKLVMAFIV